MPRPDVRSVDVIEEDLRSCAAIRQVAERELVELRRRQVELAELEATLLMTISSRWLLADRLLDERLSATRGAPGLPLVPVA